MIAAAEMYHALVVAHAENARLREAIVRLADQDATLSACDRVVTVTMDATLTLTDAEREAVEFFARLDIGANSNERYAATLRGLLERTK